MGIFLWYMYLFSAGLRICWWTLFRSRIGSTKTLAPSLNATETTGISVIVCAHNNCKGLQKLLPALLKQNYPLFEIIVVNDRSSDETQTWLSEQTPYTPQLITLHITHTPEGWNSKKYALQQGIQQAQYPLLALTDSDCIPLSDNWLNNISQTLQNPKMNIFLGYSPYAYRPGILNGIVRTETVFTALQYFSMAAIGKTYMGVGRNLGYRKSFIDKHLHQFPFQNHLGGDDDLLIGSLSNGKDAIGCTDPESFVLSYPPETITQWWTQKRRHLSAGHLYQTSTKWILGSYWLSAVVFWVFFFLILWKSSIPWTILFVHFAFFGVGSFLLMPVFRIFKELRLLKLFLFWDFLYIASLSIIGFSTFWVKNRKWS